MLLKVSTGEKAWNIFRLSDHISFGKNDIRYGWCSFPEAVDREMKEEIGVCVYHEELGAWIPYGHEERWLKMLEEPSLDCQVILNADVVLGESEGYSRRVKTKVRLLNWLIDEDEDKLYLWDGQAYILNDDGKTIERL